MKKIIGLLVALAMVAISFVGCQKNGNAIELYYYKQENQEGLKKITQAFEQANPGVKINLLIVPNDADSQMSTRAQQGKLPEIMQMQSYSRVVEYASKRFLVDLTETDAVKAALPSSLPAVTYEKKQYAVPMDYAGIGIIYNKDIFENLGIEPPQTYRDLEKVCATLQENDVVPFSALLKENWSVGHFITMIHTALLAEKGIDPSDFVAKMNAGESSYGVVDTAKLFSILDFYRENMNSNAAEMDGGAQQQSFANGEAAMMVQGLWAYVDALKLNPNLNAGFIPFPVYNDAKMNKLYADVDSTFGVSAQASEEKQKIAIDFLNWLASDEGKALWVSEYKLTHSFTGGNFDSLGTPFADLMASVAEKGAYPWAFSQYPTRVFEDACKNGAQGYMMQRSSADEVIANIDAQWAEAIAE